MTRVYIAAKTVFARMFSVWCVRVGHSSRAQCTENVHPLVLSVLFLDFFFENRRPHAEPPVSEKQKKARPYHETVDFSLHMRMRTCVAGVHEHAKNMSLCAGAYEHPPRPSL